MKTEIDFELLRSRNPKIKYGFTKQILTLAKTNPTRLYPHLNQLIEMLGSDNKIIKWIAIDAIGLLATADDENKVDSQIKTLVSFLSCGNLITANHAIFALGKIAEAKPIHFPSILSNLMAVEKQYYETAECRNIALGKVIETLACFTTSIKNDGTVLAFIERTTHNSRNATKNKALRLLKKMSR